MSLKSILTAATLAAAALTFTPQAASAMPAAPMDEAVTTHIEKTYGGCGYSGHRGPYGGCRFGGQRQVYNARRGYYGRPYYRRW
jgi:hypothetical protein